MFRTFILLAAAAFLGAGCAHVGIGGITPGVTTEAELRAKLGAPGMSWNEPDGGRQLEYSSQPMGTFCHMVFIAPDGKVREVRQVFTEANFALVMTGMTQDEARRLLGRPEEIVRFHFKPDELVWSWRIEDTGEKMVHFNAYFGADGRVLRSDRTTFYKASGASLS